MTAGHDVNIRMGRAVPLRIENAEGQISNLLRGLSTRLSPTATGCEAACGSDSVQHECEDVWMIHAAGRWGKSRACSVLTTE